MTNQRSRKGAQKGRTASDASQIREDLKAITHAYLEAIGSPKAIAIDLLLESGDVVEALRVMKVNPKDYCDYHGEAFADDYAAGSFLRKYPGLVNLYGGKTTKGLRPKDRADAALAVWRDGNFQCALTNDSFLSCFKEFSPEQRLHVDCVLTRARMHIRNCLGDDVPSWESLVETAGVVYYPSGVTASLQDARKRFNSAGNVVQTSLLEHITCEHTVTPSALAHWFRLTDVIREYDRNVVAFEPRTPERAKPRLVPYESWSNVAKTATTDRPICVQPSCNVILQRYIGIHIRDRLLTYTGVDLRHAKEANQDRLRNGGWRDVATIDIENASNTISIEAVRQLLPSNWFNVLNALRCSYARLPGEAKLVPLAMFSAMGNGFTFELESLIFWAVSKAALEISAVSGKVSVCGDDIIVPKDGAPAVIAALSAFGFRTNADKTFIDGPFRETCGLDVWEGGDVRPLFLTKEVVHHAQFRDIANGIRLYAARRGSGVYCDGRFKRVWLLAADRVPPEFRCTGTLEDTALSLWANPGEVNSYDFPRYVGCTWAAVHVHAGSVEAEVLPRHMDRLTFSRLLGSSRTLQGDGYDRGMAILVNGLHGPTAVKHASAATGLTIKDAVDYGAPARVKRRLFVRSDAPFWM